MPKTHETIRESLYRVHYRQVNAFFDRLFSDAVAADRMSEEVFSDAFTNYGVFGIRTRRDMASQENEIRVLLSRLCVKCALHHLRDDPDATIRYDWYVTDPDAPLTEDPGYSLRGEVSSHGLYRVLSSLQGNGCELLLLHHCADLPMDEIAPLYDISPEAALIRYLRARRTFYGKFRTIATESDPSSR